MKAIETAYNGYRFRSRLEARWAVFFDTLGIKYEYENEGYDLETGYYLPDFWLPQLQCWMEIKGDGDDLEAMSHAFVKAACLATTAGHPVYIFAGQIGKGARGQALLPWGPNHPVPLKWMLEQSLFRAILTTCTLVGSPDEEQYDLTECRFDLDRIGQEMVKRNRFVVRWESGGGGYLFFDAGHRFILIDPVQWAECDGCRIIFPMRWLHWDMPCECGDGGGNESPHLIEAYSAARQARFEHGEQGR